jgi:hypothetical protein
LRASQAEDRESAGETGISRDPDQRITRPADGGTHLVQTETYRGLLARTSATTVSRTEAKFAELNQALKQQAES